MKTIEVNGNPHNVDDEIASEILGARQNLENKKATKGAIQMAEAAMELARQPVQVIGRNPLYLDSADIAEGLHRDGALDVLYIGEEEVYVTPSFAQELHRDGLLIEVHADAKCSGRGWMPGGPNGKCKRVPKGTSKKVKAETKGIDRLVKGGSKNAKRSARIKELRNKLGAKGAAKKAALTKANKAATKKMNEERDVNAALRAKGVNRKRGEKSPFLSSSHSFKDRMKARKLQEQVSGIENAKARAKAAGDRTSPKRKRR